MLSFPRWKSSTSMRMNFPNSLGKVTSREANGWNFSFLSVYQESLRMFAPRIASALQELVGESAIRSVTRPADPFFGEATHIGTSPGNHWTVCYHTTAFQSPRWRFSLDKESSARVASEKVRKRLVWGGSCFQRESRCGYSVKLQRSTVIIDH
jgi:hypothetical protein